MWTEMLDFDPEDILSIAAAWHGQGEATAIATVVDTWGSAPRPRGSRMALTASGRATFDTGAPQLLEFGISNERAWEAGLACGGKLTVFLERIG